MRLGPGDFLRRYFSELEAQNIPSVILNYAEGFPDLVSSDVDYAVPTRDLPKLIGLTRALAQRHGWRVAQVIEPHIDSLFVVVVDGEDPLRFLQLDVCGHYVESGCFFFSDAELLNGRAPVEVFFRPTPEVEFGYLLAKALAKGTPMAQLLSRLESLWQREPVGCEAQLEKLVGRLEGGFKKWVALSVPDLERLRQAALRRHRFRLGNRLREALRATRRVARPKGLHLALLGPEGPVTSAVLERLGSMIQAPFFRSPQLYEFGPGGKGRGAWSVLRALGWAVDYFSLYVMKVTPAKVRNVLVIISPSPDDLLLNPARYGFRAAGWFIRALSRVLPRADLTVILATPPKEDTRGESRLRWLAAQRMAEGSSRYVVVSMEQPLDDVLREICGRVIEYMVRRENG
jgi:hypothetical protein